MSTIDVFDYHPNKLLTINELVGKDGYVGVSKSTWYKGMAAGEYPKPVKISPRRRGWRAGDIQKLLKSMRPVD